MKHLDLFSGIGGFALAIDQVWGNVEHIFCEIDPFCQQILKKHWPNSKIYDDIKTLTAERIAIDTISNQHRAERGKVREAQEVPGGHRPTLDTGRACGTNSLPAIDLLTGGFPCQPFSQAGKRRAQADNRFLWPEMLRVIKETKPTWIIGENVAGIIELALEQVCLDLEAEGYEVRPIIIPACAVNAPHRRDRVWIIANRTGKRGQCGECGECGECSQSEKRLSGWDNSREWDRDWIEVATKLCGVDDGLPVELHGFKLTKAQNRTQRLKALGNAIVPQVALEIMKGIKANE